MKNIKLKMLYFIWNYFVSKNKFPKLCERINILINKIESK